MKSISFVVGKEKYGVLEEKTERNYSYYIVFRSGQYLGRISIPDHMIPSFSISETGRVVIYGGCSINLVKNDYLKKAEEDEFIHSIWFHGDHIFAECDTILSYRRLSDLSIEKQYDHGEIITNGLFRSSKSFAFQDLQNRVHELNLDDFTTSESDYPFKRL